MNKPRKRIGVSVMKPGHKHQFVRSDDGREAWVANGYIRADNTVTASVFDRLAAGYAQHVCDLADPEVRAHRAFDREMQQVETDLETAGLVIVDGTWRNTKTGEMGPVPLAFAEGKLFRGAIEGRGYVLGRVLRAAVVNAVAEAGLNPADADITITVAGVTHEFNAAGEIPALITAHIQAGGK